MKSKKGFRPLRRKIFLRAVTVLAATTIAIYFSYTVLLQGHFANGMIALFQSVLGVDYDVALQFYEHIFRSHKDAIILLSLLLVAVGLPRLSYRSAS